MKYKILVLNAISEKGLKKFDAERYIVGEQVSDPDAILVRSANMHDMAIPESVKVIGRAGVGVNNIPVSACTNAGIPVLNAPGANANAVKELVITGMLLACRNICAAWDYSRQLQGDDDELNVQVEKNKKRFSGFELPNKTLGVIGLGNVGVKVANAAVSLGMKVIGFDQSITVHNAWKLSASVEQGQSIAEICKRSDFITLHVPLLDATRHLINASLLKIVKTGVVLLNFSRDGIVDSKALQQALVNGRVSQYVCDFPSAIFQNNPRVIALPHLGASTREAEENCAVMVAENIRQCLENGVIRYAVNFPNVSLPPSGNYRLAIANRNVPNIIAQITSTLSSQNINILDMINKSREEIAYNLLDVDAKPDDKTIHAIEKITGVVRVRSLLPV